MSPRLEELCLEVVRHHRDRMFAMEQRKRADLAVGAFLRSQLGWEVDLPEKERAAIAAEAVGLIGYGAALLAGKEVGPAPAAWPEYETLILATLKAQEPFLSVEAQKVKKMAVLAKQLPVWPWAAKVRGLGAVSLAVIVGEATTDDAPTLGAYRTKGGLWKRMGVATVDGVAQGKLGKGAAADDWIRHGYSARRRSQMWVIGDCLIKTNRDGPYRTLYLERKERERERDPEAKPIVLHRRAQRVMEQRLLADLWRAWRKAA